MAFLIAFGLMFLVVALTIVFGGISKLGDKRVEREGRPTADMRPASPRYTTRDLTAH